MSTARRGKPPTHAAAARIAASAVERGQGPGYPSWCPGLSLLEEIQHVRLNVVRVGPMADALTLSATYSSVQGRARPLPLGSTRPPTHLWPRFTPIRLWRGLRSAPLKRCAGSWVVRP